MRTSKLIAIGLAAIVGVTTGRLIVQHNQLVAQSEQLAARNYQLKTQKEELQARSERLQAQMEQSSAANISKRSEIKLASQAELPDLVVSAPRLSAQER
ncbi:MAG TPA: hypothetical protein VGO37_18640 [Steroidobacteraceae bacterium]|jgi:uncharacterized protein (DUF3084 family)|nr:hypothetical protein [Steroidobacteraceae bacterium]